jgi:hypothetical protein
MWWTPGSTSTSSRLRARTKLSVVEGSKRSRDREGAVDIGALYRSYQFRLCARSCIRGVLWFELGG